MSEPQTKRGFTYPRGFGHAARQLSDAELLERLNVVRRVYHDTLARMKRDYTARYALPQARLDYKDIQGICLERGLEIETELV